MKGTRIVQQSTLTLGTPLTVQLPRNYCHRALHLKLTGTVDVTVGTTAFSALSQGIANVLSNIRVRRDGKDTPFSLPGYLTYELNKLLYGKAGAITLPSLAANGTNVAAAVHLAIPFENVGGVKPFDTLLKSSNLSALDLIIDTQAASNISNGGDGTIAVNSSFILEVSTVEELGVNNFVFGDLKTYLAQRVAVSGASNNFQIKPLPVGNRYKGFMLFVEDAGAPSDSVITNIKLKSGTNVFVDRPAQALKDEWMQKMNIASMSTGAYYIDLMPDGMLNQTLDVTPESGNQTLELELTCAAPTTPCYVNVVAIEYVAPALVKKA